MSYLFDLFSRIFVLMVFTKTEIMMTQVMFAVPCCGVSYHWCNIRIQMPCAVTCYCMHHGRVFRGGNFAGLGAAWPFDV